jgi:hypothetical protein
MIPEHPYDHSFNGFNRCLLEQADAAIPERWKHIWQKAVDWEPKLHGWTNTKEQALELVLAGQRPIYYGWRHDTIQQAVKDHNLQYFDFGWVSAASLRKNADMLVLLAWSHEQPDEIQHIVNGVVLRYPLTDVEHWVVCGCPGKTLREMLKETPGNDASNV